MKKNNHRNPDRISTINEEKFNQTLDNTLFRNLSKLKIWFENHRYLEDNIEGLIKDIKNPPYEFGEGIISNEFILSFLNLQKADNISAKHWMEQHFKKNLNSPLEIEILTKTIEKH